MSFSAVRRLPPPGQDQAPAQLSDIRRYGRYVVNRFVSQARTVDRPTFRSILTDHLGGPCTSCP